MTLGRILSTLAFEHGLGEVLSGPFAVVLGDDTVTEPDLLFVRRDRLDVIEPDRGVLGPPDLVVEILSPSNRAYDRNLKRRRYQAAGVPEVWIVDADEDTIEVWRPGSSVPELPGDAVEWRVGDQGFRIALADIFRR
jgi:Uma2 family endonuclease